MSAVPGLVDASTGFDNNNVGEDVMSHLQQRQHKAALAASAAAATLAAGNNEVRRPHIYDCPPAGGQHTQPPPKQYLHTKKSVRLRKVCTVTVFSLENH